MIPRIIVSVLFYFICAISFGQQTKKITLYFNYGKGELTTPSMQRIDSILDKIRQASRIDLAGYTDNDGDENYNLKLSKRRVNVVHQYLISRGIEQQKMLLAHYGKNYPIASNDSPIGRQMNRRVEIILQLNSITTDNEMGNQVKFVNTLPCDPSLYQLTTKEILYFNYGKHEATENSKNKMNNLVSGLKNKNIVEISLSGHTDGDGSIPYNLQLSKERVEIVQHYLFSLGIANDKVKGAYYGKSQPLALNNTEAGKQKNRRVEMIIKFNDCVETKEDLVKKGNIENDAAHQINPTKASKSIKHEEPIEISPAIILKPTSDEYTTVNSRTENSEIIYSTNEIVTPVEATDLSTIDEVQSDANDQIIELAKPTPVAETTNNFDQNYSHKDKAEATERENKTNSTLVVLTSVVDSQPNLLDVNEQKDLKPNALIPVDKDSVNNTTSASVAGDATEKHTQTSTFVDSLSEAQIILPQPNTILTTNKEKNPNEDVQQFGDLKSNSNAMNDLHLAQNEKENAQHKSTDHTPLPIVSTVPIQTRYAEVNEEKMAHMQIDINYNATDSAININNGTPSAANIVETPIDDLQIYTVATNTEVTIKGEHGTSITFPKNSFVDKNGQLLNENVIIQLREVYTKSDMLNNNLTTVSEGELLESGGMVNVKVMTQNSEEVFLEKNSNYKIEFPAETKKNGMNLFYDDHHSNGQNWSLADKASEKDSASIENQKVMDKYVFKGSKLGWLNCDRFTGMNNKTNLKVNIADINQTNVCLVFTHINSVLNVSQKDKGFVFSRIPIGEQATLVAFSKKADAIFYASKTITIEKNAIETLTLEKLTETEFQQRIKQLN